MSKVLLEREGYRFIEAGILFLKNHFNYKHDYVYLTVEKANYQAYHAYLKSGFQVMDDKKEEVLMRKKWLNALYQHVVFHNDEQDLPAYLLGWRYDVLTKPLIDVLHADESYLSTQMKVMD